MPPKLRGGTAAKKLWPPSTSSRSGLASTLLPLGRKGKTSRLYLTTSCRGCQISVCAGASALGGTIPLHVLGSCQTGDIPAFLPAVYGFIAQASTNCLPGCSEIGYSALLATSRPGLDGKWARFADRWLELWFVDALPDGDACAPVERLASRLASERPDGQAQG